MANVNQHSDDITPVSEQQVEQGTPKEKVNYVSRTRKKPDRQTRNTGKKGSKSTPIEIPTLKSIEDLMEVDEPLQPIVEPSSNRSRDVYDKADQHENAIKKLESRGVSLEIQEKLKLKWIPKKTAIDDYHNFHPSLVSPWGVILIPYTFTHIDGFNGQAYNFYPTDEIQKQETEKRTLKGYDKQPKYLNPKGSKRQDYPVYDPYLLLNPKDKGKKVFMITEDTFGVIIAALQGYRCWSSRLGVSLISNDEIVLLGKDGKKKTEIVNKLGQEEPVITGLMSRLGYKVPWFPDNDWINKPNVWTETIKTSVYLGLGIGVFNISENKIGLDEYLINNNNLDKLSLNICNLEEFISEFSCEIKFKILKKSVAIQTLQKHHGLSNDIVHILNRYPELKTVIRDSYDKVDSFRMLDKILRDNFEDKLRFNQLTSEIELTEHSGVLLDKIDSWLLETYDVSFSSSISVGKILSHLEYLAVKDIYHPMEEYLLAMADRYKNETIESIGNLAERYLGTSDPLHDQILKKCIFYSTISRILNPGCLVKAMVVLTGLQSAGKTSFLRNLLPNGDWCISGAMKDVESKDGIMTTQQSVIMEWGEVTRILNPNNLESVKNFLTRKNDHIRLPYGKTLLNLPRRFIIAGTTNEEEILRDVHDHTRFKIIPIPKDWKIPLDLIREERDRLWGVMTNWWLNLSVQEREECLWYSELEEQASLQESDKFRQVDACEAHVLTWAYEKVEKESDVSKKYVQVFEILKSMYTDVNDNRTQKKVVRILKQDGWTVDKIYINKVQVKIYRPPTHA